ncbi:50S ribosomal protein L4 [Candidatus Saccharibacteria bacterium]|nr:50S ribosomal protein L4 [Candidatus Saccharibacteria bacterium]NIV03732.1 50S ribosomal protein L4 [Calditrichia bacterium]NIV72033.1 50S ribosomal protein L4 [Calditrichia bacterium]NIV98866.1 50S ribosomal protein L4 [Candidatus Saccharibacteria bacterium]NIW79143.1 50S ribosomal protein L4 [Calditrichia bacterium]
MELKVYRTDGSLSNKKVTLRPEVFEIEPNDKVLYLAVKAYRANQRQGTSSVKSRSEVSGGGAKPFRQKGTGRARQGTIRAAHMVGGGRAFGPHPRDFRQKLPKKVRLLARKSALAYKAKEEKIIVVEDFQFEEPKTRRVMDLLESLNIVDQKVFILTTEHDQNLYKSVRNIPYKWVNKAPQFSVYDIMNSQVLVLQKGAVEILNEVYGQ